MLSRLFEIYHVWGARLRTLDHVGIVKENPVFKPFFMKSPQREAISPAQGISTATIVAISLTSLVLLSACSKPQEKKEDIRPVRTVQAVLQDSQSVAEFAGEVRPRVESKLGFRVPGKIIERKVDVGAPVKRGQVLMRLDPQDLLLGQAQAKAGLAAAESNRDLAKAELKRYQELRDKNFVAQAILDAKASAFRAAQSSYEQAAAGFSNQTNQANYTSLVADVDGVVTAIDAEIGQVVAAGTPVVRVAKAGEMEVVVGVPEDKINRIRQMVDVKVRLWAKPSDIMNGKLRELSPIADPVTRTYTAKVSIPDAAKEVRLGMTADVSFGMKNPQQWIRLPLTALFQEKNVSSVWVVENDVVRLVPVQLATTTGEDIMITSGVNAGQQVVTAGVNLLKAGQKVKILGVEARNGDAALAASSTKTEVSK